MKKSIKVKNSINIDGTENIDISCNYCGDPIVKSTKYGMDCQNGCIEKKTKDLLSSNSDMKKIFDMFNK